MYLSIGMQGQVVLFATVTETHIGEHTLFHATGNLSSLEWLPILDFEEWSGVPYDIQAPCELIALNGGMEFPDGFPSSFGIPHPTKPVVWVFFSKSCIFPN